MKLKLKQFNGICILAVFAILALYSSTVYSAVPEVINYQGALFSLTPSEILSATSGDFDGSGQDDLLLNFGGATGLLVLFNGANVSPLGALPLVAATSGDVDNNGEDDMILSITGTGTIAFKNLTTVDTLDPAAATGLATGNVDGN